MISNIFKEILKQQEQYVAAHTGEDFENKLINLLKTFQFNKILNNKAAKVQGEKSIENQITKLISGNLRGVNIQWMHIKQQILSKNSCALTINPWPSLEYSYIHQPFGSQDFPDFIFFTKKYIIPVEVKYSTSKESTKEANLKSAKPMWNSNLPKGNGIYIFGVAGKKATFFLGSSVLDSETRISLNRFFDDIGAGEDGLNLTSKMEVYLRGLPNPFGFKPYMRRAFDQSKEFSTLMDDDGKKVVESYFSETASKREKEVISFLDSLEDAEFVK